MKNSLFYQKHTQILIIGLFLFWSIPCLSAPSGTVKWGYKTAKSIRSTPAVGLDGTIYFGSDDNYIYALNPNGTLKWNYDAKGWVRSSPVVDSDGVIYCASDTQSYGLFALNPNGSLKWKSRYSWIEGAIVLGPDGDIYFSDHESVFALYSNGTLKWKYLLKNQYVYPTSPAVGLDGTIYFGCGDYYIYALNPNGSLKWKHKTGDQLNSSSPAIGLDGTVYMGSGDDYIYALNPNGSVKWQYKTGDDVESAPGLGIDGTVYCGSNDGYFYALNPNGSLKWRFKTGLYKSGSSIYSTPAIGLDGSVYFSTFDGWIYALNPNGTLKWNYGTGGNINSSPTLAIDGTLYCGSEDTYMYAFNNSKNYHYSMPVFKPKAAYWSGLGITNLTNKKSANVTVLVYSQTGTVMESESKYIPAHGQNKFLIGSTLKNDGWIKVQSDQPLSGMNLLGQYEGNSKDYYLADVPFTSFDSLATLLIVPHVAQNDIWDTIVYLANPNNSAASVTLTYVSREGTGSTPYPVSIPADGSKEISLSTIGSSTSLSGGYVLISSTQGLTAFALFNNLKTGNLSYAGINAVDVTKQ